MRTAAAAVADRIDRQAARSAHPPEATPTRQSQTVDGGHARTASRDSRAAAQSSPGWIRQTPTRRSRDRCPYVQTTSSAPDQPLRTPSLVLDVSPLGALRTAV